MIRAIKLGKHYPNGQPVLKDVDFHLPKGHMAFLTGPSGAGKSTLLKLITRMEKLSSGRLLFDGEDLGALKHRHIPKLRRQIGVVFQDHKLLMDRDVFANVALTLQVAGMGSRQIKSCVAEALERVGLRGRETDSPLHLSGGEQQRVGIARAIVHSPRLVLADEPTGNLDPQLSNEVMRLFADLNQEGMTVLIATHDASAIRAFRHPVYRLVHGRIEEEENFS